MADNATVPGPAEAGPTWTGFLHGATDFGVFLGLVLAGYLVGTLLRRAAIRLGRSRPTSGRLLFGKTAIVLFTLMGMAAGLRLAFGVDLGSLATTLGIVSIALGFGLQNTVANLAAGVGLSLDKPFEVGDRIRVGETWGDVTSVGLRSTRITTTGGEHVIIPNSVLDTREVWNNTRHGDERLRLAIPVSITFDSSIALAEQACLRVARAVEDVLAYPPPRVTVRQFGDSSVDLQLRVWLRNARLKPLVLDRLLRGIKDAFDQDGVHFPFPQRILTYARDLPAAAPTPSHLDESVQHPPVILVVAHSMAGAHAFAGAAALFAQRVRAGLLVLHVGSPYQDAEMQRGSAEALVNVYVEAAAALDVPARGRLDVGFLPDAVAAAAKQEGAVVVVFGQSRSATPGFFGRRELQAIKEKCPVPLLAMEREQLLRAEVVDFWKEKLHEVAGGT